MKKKLVRFVTFLMTCIVLCFGAGCSVVGKKLSTSGEGEYVRCAPCTPWEIWQWNEACYQEFFPAHRVSALDISLIKYSVNGQDWPESAFMEQELSPGIYKIRFYAPEGSILMKDTREEYWYGYVHGWEEVPFEADITLIVHISSMYEDVCDVNYRKENGLWTDARTLDWYENCKAQWW